VILRRVIAHVRKQEWTAIGIDFFIVVVGVFVGIQVANWNAAAIERREARGAMLRLEEDLRLSIELTQSAIDFMAENSGYADKVFDRLAACQLPAADRDDFANGLYRLGKMVPARLVRTTFDELRDNGKIALIGNDALRRELNDTARRQDSHEVVFRLQVTRTDPHIAYIETFAVYDIDGAIGGASRIGWNQLDIDFDGVCHDRRFRAAVGAVRNYTYDVLSDVENRQKRFRELLAMVEKENAR
jgi:hypothetical protein